MKHIIEIAKSNVQNLELNRDNLRKMRNDINNQLASLDKKIREAKTIALNIQNELS